MSVQKPRSLASLFGAFGSAVAAAAAVHVGQSPEKRDLIGLGIDPKQFRDIKRYY